MSMGVPARNKVESDSADLGYLVGEGPKYGYVCFGWHAGDEAFHRGREQRHPSELVRTDFSGNNPGAMAPNETLDAIP